MRHRRCGARLVVGCSPGPGVAIQLHNIADENTAAPGRSDKFTDAVNASLSGHTVTFIGTHGACGPGNPMDYGIHTANTTGTPVVVRVTGWAAGIESCAYKGH